MVPTDIKLHQVSGILEILFEGGEVFNLSAEYLRVFSPSAEVKGHGPGQEVLQHGKKMVKIANLEAQGNYAIRLLFPMAMTAEFTVGNIFMSLARNSNQTGRHIWHD